MEKLATSTVETGSGEIEVTASSGDDLSFETGSGKRNVALDRDVPLRAHRDRLGRCHTQSAATSSAEVDLAYGKAADIDLGGLTLQVRRIAHDHARGRGGRKGRVSVETGSGRAPTEALEFSTILLLFACPYPRR